MGFFKRTKKEEIYEPTEPVQEQIRVKSHEEIEKERITNELQFVEAELKSKIEHLNLVSEKLDKVKSEYNELVGTLMASKKEANERKTEMDVQRTQHRQILKQIDAAKLELETTKRQIEEKKATLAETTIKIQESANQNLLRANSDLGATKLEIAEFRKELEARKIELDLANKELKFIEAQTSNAEDHARQKNIVAAASSVVSSLNAKILAMQKEMEVIKTTLQREREEHQETKNNLHKIQKLKDGLL